MAKKGQGVETLKSRPYLENWKKKFIAELDLNASILLGLWTFECE